MGKFILYLSVLIILDILMLVTGQITVVSPSSTILNAILGLEGIKATLFWVLTLGVVGIAGVVATTGVSKGIFSTATNVLAFGTLAIALGTLVGDWIAIFISLRQINDVLATVIMAPIVMIFLFVVVEWLRGKD